jgi:hypothetical protein
VFLDHIFDKTSIDHLDAKQKSDNDLTTTIFCYAYQHMIKYLSNTLKPSLFEHAHNKYDFLMTIVLQQARTILCDFSRQFVDITEQNWTALHLLHVLHPSVLSQHKQAFLD